MSHSNQVLKDILKCLETNQEVSKIYPLICPITAYIKAFCKEDSPLIEEVIEFFPASILTTSEREKLRDATKNNTPENLVEIEDMLKLLARRYMIREKGYLE
jgi:hypothetical protein